MQAHEQTVIVLIPNHFNAALYYALRDCILNDDRKVLVAGRKAGASLTDSESQDVLTVDIGVDDANRSDYQALVILDSATPDEMEASRRNFGFIESALDKKKILGAVDRGVEMLVAAAGERLSGRHLAGPEESQTYIEGVGAIFSTENIEEDGVLLTARTNNDIDRFCRALLVKLRAADGIAA